MELTTQIGASAQDWAHFDLVLGLGADLLPVVCDIEAQISPASKIKKLGKVPTLFDSNGLVVGIKDWPLRKSTHKEIDRWSNEPVYGICLQTRAVRALDVDVPNVQKAQVIELFIEDYLFKKLPKRMRTNSGKFLLAFKLEGEYGKMAIEVDGGIIEFLANGQQFVAIGQHESGVPYCWDGGLPSEIPELAPEEFKALWDALCEEFATGDILEADGHKRKRGPNLLLQDETADYLEEQGLSLGAGNNNGILIKCPWSDQHTGGTDGDGSTIYMRAGTNSYQRGHFRCLHIHCKGRTDDDFMSALGVIANQFTVLAPGAASQPIPWPDFTREKSGRIHPTLPNLSKALRRSDLCLFEIGFDLFKDEIMKAEPGTSNWVPFKDSDYSRIRIQVEKLGFKPIGPQMIRDGVALIADENRFDSAQIWLESLVWDGVPRVSGFLRDYFEVEENEYTTAASNYVWSALAGRVLEPGVKADMVLILVGLQGAGKSTAVSSMVPDLQFFTEISFSEKDDNLARMMRGRLIAELGELRGLNTKDLEGIKAFITRQQESWIPKWREFATSYMRRTVFIGTTNADEFLADETGNRRFLPVKTGNVDVAAIARDCLQLWAEARDMYKLLGIQWRGVEELAKPSHAEHAISDLWEEPIRTWLETQHELTGIAPIEQPYLRGIDILQNALGIDPKNATRREQMRIGKVLRTLGYKPKKVWDQNKMINVYLPTSSNLWMEVGGPEGA